MQGIAERRPIMHELHGSLRAAQNARTLADRRSAGRELRKKVPRSSHAEWTPAADRSDPLSLLEEQNCSRLPHLVPLRYERMAVSPFTFLRGWAVVMAQDLAATPITGIQVQVCGDAHLSDFGIAATTEGNHPSETKQLDETLPAPGEGENKRCTASIIVAGRSNASPAA